MNKDELIHEIGGTLVADIGKRHPDWVHLVLAGSVNGEQAQMNGFSYDAAGESTPTGPRVLSVLRQLVALNQQMAADDRSAPWRACLITIDHGTGEIDFAFEYDDPGRWTITPANTESRAKEFAPSAK